MIIFNIISFSVLFRLLGGGFSIKTDFPRCIILTIVITLIAVNSRSVLDGMANFMIFSIIRLLPTQALLATCIDNTLPNRKDGRWQFLQEIAFDFYYRIPSFYREFKYFGFIYGIIRMLLAIPAIIYLGNYWFLTFFFIGFIYYISKVFCNKFKLNNPVRVSELILGALYGLII